MVYLCLGSNLGGREKNILTAVKLLNEHGVDVVKKSSLYETSPWPIRSPAIDTTAGSSDIISELTSNGLKEVGNQPYFLNLVLEAETKLSPEELLKEIKKIEKEIGRKPSKKWGPRKIDIDILFYDDILITTPKLTIPHTQLHKRAFVLAPLKEIAPHFVHPLIKKTVSRMLKDSDDKGSVVVYNKRVPAYQDNRMKNIRKNLWRGSKNSGHGKKHISSCRKSTSFARHYHEKKNLN